MKKVYALSPQELHDAIQNVIRVYDDYALDRLKPDATTYRVLSGDKFYLLKYFDVSGGTEVKITAGRAFGKMTEAEAVPLVSAFFSRIDQIVNGRIVLTPDVANKDVFKSGRGAIAMLTVLKFVVALIAIAIALGVLFH